MTEQFIWQYIRERIRQLEYACYQVLYRDLMIEAQSVIHITAYNELYYIVDDPALFIVESDYGLYDSTVNSITENVHQHRGEIVIGNRSIENKRIKFIQVIIIN